MGRFGWYNVWSLKLPRLEDDGRFRRTDPTACLPQGPKPEVFLVPSSRSAEGAADYGTLQLLIPSGESRGEQPEMASERMRMRR